MKLKSRYILRLFFLWFGSILLSIASAQDVPDELCRITSLSSNRGAVIDVGSIFKNIVPVIIYPANARVPNTQSISQRYTIECLPGAYYDISRPVVTINRYNWESAYGSLRPNAPAGLDMIKANIKIYVDGMLKDDIQRTGKFISSGDLSGSGGPKTYMVTQSLRIEVTLEADGLVYENRNDAPEGAQPKKSQYDELFSIKGYFQNEFYQYAGTLELYGHFDLTPTTPCALPGTYITTVTPSTVNFGSFSGDTLRKDSEVFTLSTSYSQNSECKRVLVPSVEIVPEGRSLIGNNAIDLNNGYKLSLLSQFGILLPFNGAERITMDSMLQPGKSSTMKMKAVAEKIPGAKVVPGKFETHVKFIINYR